MTITRTTILTATPPATPPDDEGQLHDELEQLLDNDKQLQNAYMRAIQEIGSEWTDEKIAEAAFTLIYGENIADLMAAWRWKQRLFDPTDTYARSVHIAVIKYNYKQRKDKAYAGV